MDVEPISLQQRIAQNYEVNHGRKPEKKELQTQEHSVVKRAGVVVEGMPPQTPRGILA